MSLPQWPVRDLILCADAREAVRGLADASVDAVVTDPPAGIAFMGKDWDNPWENGLNGHGYTDGAQRVPAPAITSTRNPMCRTCHKHKRGWKDTSGCSCTVPDFDDLDRTRRARQTFIATLVAVFEECRRVLKPGGYALVWALPRTSHWTATALEDAGFEIRDSVHHIFGSGFPKSKSCIKPAHEVWWLAKAPGPLQPLEIDACRLRTDEIGSPRAYEPRQDREQWRITGGSNGSGATSPAGRWPPNLLLSHHPDCRPAGVRRVAGITGGTGNHAGHVYGARSNEGQAVQHYADAEGYEQVQSWVCVDGCPIKALDEQAGPRSSGAMKAGTRRANTCGYRGAMPDQTMQDTYGDTGSASRFFPSFAPEPEDAVPWMYCPKASRREREAGLDDVDPASSGYRPNDPNENTIRTRLHGSRPVRNSHPTVKPIALMQWLCRLVCPANGLVLDPFAGSGSTGVACVREGLHYLLVEQDPAYVEIARRRIAHEQEQQAGPLFAGLGGT